MCQFDCANGNIDIKMHQSHRLQKRLGANLIHPDMNHYEYDVFISLCFEYGTMPKLEKLHQKAMIFYFKTKDSLFFEFYTFLQFILTISILLCHRFFSAEWQLQQFIAIGLFWEYHNNNRYG